MKTAALLTAFLALVCLLFTVVGCALPLWSKFDSSTLTTTEVGIWQTCVVTTLTDNRVCAEFPASLLDSAASHASCEGYVLAVRACSIIAACFFFFILLLAALAIVKPATKPIAGAIFCISLLALIFNVLAWVFWFAFGEYDNCTLGVVGMPTPLRNYDASFNLVVISSAVAVLIPCFAALMFAKVPPKVKEVTVPVPVQYEYAPAYAPAYTTAYTAPAYPTAAPVSYPTVY
jgi:hypothetical protein